MFYKYKLEPPDLLAYDDACHLKKFLENRAKDGAKFARWLLAKMAFCVDKCAPLHPPAPPARPAPAPGATPACRLVCSPARVPVDSERLALPRFRSAVRAWRARAAFV